MHRECLRPVPETLRTSDKQVLSKDVVSPVTLTVYAMNILHVTRGSPERTVGFVSPPAQESRQTFLPDYSTQCKEPA